MLPTYFVCPSESIIVFIDTIMINSKQIFISWISYAILPEFLLGEKNAKYAYLIKQKRYLFDVGFFAFFKKISTIQASENEMTYLPNNAAMKTHLMNFYACFIYICF